MIGLFLLYNSILVAISIFTSTSIFICIGTCHFLPILASIFMHIPRLKFLAHAELEMGLLALGALLLEISYGISLGDLAHGISACSMMGFTLFMSSVCRIFYFEQAAYADC